MAFTLAPRPSSRKAFAAASIRRARVRAAAARGTDTKGAQSRLRLRYASAVATSFDRKPMDVERQSPTRTLLILGAGTLAFVLAQTTVIPALGDIQKELHASANGITWMVTAYLLVASIAT